LQDPSDLSNFPNQGLVAAPSDPSAEVKLEGLEQEILRDGLLMLRGFFSTEEADQARSEINRWLELDLQERAAVGADRQTSPAWHHFEGAAGNSDLSRYAHGLSDCWGKSPALDGMMLKLITDPVFGSLLERLAGHDYRLLTLFCRRMTGERDRQLDGLAGQRWHRDGRGGATIGILLSDIPEGDNGSTKMVLGSHEFPYDPQLCCLLSRDGSPVHPLIRTFRLANRVLERKLNSRFRAASGKKGDVYLFLSETWHGRQENLNGNAGVVALVGLACATGAPSGDCDTLLSPEELAKVPPLIGERLQGRVPPREGEHPLIHKVVAAQSTAKHSSLFYWAMMERSIGETLKREGFAGVAKRLFRRLAL